jgi:hypothetical protein
MSADITPEELKTLRELNALMSDRDTSRQDLAGKLLNVENPLERTNAPHMSIVLLNVRIQQAAEFLSDYFKDIDIKTVLTGWGTTVTSALIAFKTGAEGGRMTHIKDILKQAPETVQYQTGSLASQGEKPRLRDAIMPKREDDSI